MSALGGEVGLVWDNRIEKPFAELLGYVKRGGLIDALRGEHGRAAAYALPTPRDLPAQG